MAVVDFKQIPLYANNLQDIPILSSDIEGGGSGIVYNEDWGYFTFSQSIEFTYSPDAKYVSTATFAIRGVFTRNATASGIVEPSGSYGASDEENELWFNSLKDKYNNLVDLMNAAAESEAPVNFADWWGATDGRVMELPYPLLGPSGVPVYGRPVSLNVEESQWPNLIVYNAVLKEPIPASGKVTVDEHIIDRGIITIKARKPRTRIQNFAFANSSEIYFGGWDERSYSVAGSLPSVPPSGQVASTAIHDLTNDLMDGRVTIGKNIEGTYTAMFSDLYIENSGVSFSKMPDGRGTDVNVSATE